MPVVIAEMVDAGLQARQRRLITAEQLGPVLQQIEFCAAEMAIGKGYHHGGAQELFRDGGICREKPRQISIVHRPHRLPVEFRFRQGFREVLGEHAPFYGVKITIGQSQLVQGREPDLE